MANDRILVSVEDMQDAIGKYQNAQRVLEDAFTGLDNAKKHLDRCYKGPAYVALAARLVSLYANVRTAENGLRESIQGLQKNIQEWSITEVGNGSKGGGLDTGAAPAFL